ncbi:hypothetical protein D9615_000287 [Tricholomella constricta]|uniref:Aldehyde dehydrogenase domain-containing protein n=1 Tax=Tricholomella constricta TaxID=117010 RepID=A0A8H5MBW9_9AGAR|nr:hypothetical protein D9615_000287 [Tricholomella constricta]
MLRSVLPIFKSVRNYTMAQPVIVNIPAINKQITVPTGLFINNEFVASVDSKDLIHAVNPATEDVICSVVAASPKDIDLAVAAARNAFRTTWGKNVTGFERSKLIHKLADLIERDAQELSELEALNNGKPSRIARDFDIGDSVQCLRYYAGWADKIIGQTLEVDNKTKLAFTRHDPIGVCVYRGTIPSTCGSRVYVQDTVYDKFIILLVSKVKAQVIGDGLDEKSGGGPVVSKGQYDKVWGYIEAGKQEGAKAILGGAKRSGKGFFVEPTIFTEIRPEMKIVKEEIFGPVLSVGRFSTEDEAIALANDTSYGLGAGLHSNDANQCMRVSSALEAGTIWVNQYNILNNNVPFGGKKQSGIGRELGSYALDEYTSIKAVHWNFGEKLDWPL